MVEPTYENALTELKTIHYGGVGAYTDDSFVYELAFEALERQIKKAVIPSKEEAYYGFCPNCNHALKANINHHYCQFCGQALDWCEWEEEE